MNYFLIELHNRDGDKEYYDNVSIRTEMSNEDLRANKNFWEECLLSWQFHWIEQDDNDDWRADLRIVSVNGWSEVSEKEYEVLEKYLGGWKLENIIADAQGNYEPNEKNANKYFEEVA
tara:strand:+ start:265 stop:618 length:354 start_codon:yes stop_codon:yes gene_type:complete